MSSRRRAPAPPDIAQDWQPEGTGGGGRGARGSGSTGMLPGAPIGGGAPRPGVGIVLLPPTVIRPDTAQSIFRLGQSAAGAPFTQAATPVIIPGSQFTIPANNVGVLRSIVLHVNTLLVTSQIVWTLLFDGSPVQGYDNLSVFPQAVGSFNLSFGPDEVQIPVPEGTQISVRIDVQDLGGTYQAGVTYTGWFYSRRIDEVFRDAWRV